MSAPTAEEIATYLTEEIGSIIPGDLKCELDGKTVIVRTTRWLGDKWGDVMAYLDGFDAEWHSEGKNSHWTFDSTWMEDRVEEKRWEKENRPTLEWWIRQPKNERDYITGMDDAAWKALTRDQRAAIVKAYIEAYGIDVTKD